MPEADTDDDDWAEIEIDPELMTKLRDAQQAYDEVEEYFTGLKNEVKQRLAEAGAGKTIAKCNGEKVFTYSVYRTTRIDGPRLKKDFPDIWQQYSKGVEQQRLAVTRWKS